MTQRGSNVHEGKQEVPSLGVKGSQVQILSALRGFPSQTLASLWGDSSCSSKVRQFVCQLPQAQVSLVDPELLQAARPPQVAVITSPWLLRALHRVRF